MIGCIMNGENTEIVVEHNSSQAPKRDRHDNLWRDFDLSVVHFCYKQSLRVFESDILVNTLVGEELEWFGSHGLLFLVNKLIENEVEIRSLEARYATSESCLDNEVSTSRTLRSQLTRAQREAQDVEWQYQEQLATAGNMLQLEKELSRELHRQIAQLSMQLSSSAELHSETNSNLEESSVRSASAMTTPAPSWRDSSRRSTGSSWSSEGRSQIDKLLRVAEKLNITAHQDIIDENG